MKFKIPHSPLQPGPLACMLFSVVFIGMGMFFAVFSPFGPWERAFLGTFCLLFAVWYIGVTGMLYPLRVLVDAAGVKIVFYFRSINIKAEDIVELRTVGPEVLSWFLRLHVRMGGFAWLWWTTPRSREFGAVDVFAVYRDMVLIRRRCGRPVLVAVDDLGQFIDEVSRHIPTDRPAQSEVSRPAATRSLDCWRWMLFAWPAAFVLLCAAFGSAWVYDAESSLSPLHRAVRNGSVKEVQRLAAEDPDLLESRDRRGYTPLHMAQDSIMITSLLDAGADIEAKSNSGHTALQFSTLPRAYPEVFDTLIARGADIQTADHNGQTPLHKAARYGNVHAVRGLIRLGAKVNARDKFGHSPLYYAQDRFIRHMIKSAGGVE
jgi:hypothetical protein